MRELSAAQEALQVSLQEKLASAKAEVTSVIAKANEVIAAYNDILEEAENFKDKIVSEQHEYYDSKSETWKDSDDGNEYENWKDSWENSDFSLLEIIEDPSFPDALDDLTVAP